MSESETVIPVEVVAERESPTKSTIEARDNLAAATGDEYQEDLYIFEDLQYILQGFGDVHQLRIRVSPTTGVLVLLDREAPLELPGFVERFTDETDPDIVGA